MKKRFHVLAFVLVVLLLSTACGGNKEKTLDAVSFDGENYAVMQRESVPAAMAAPDMSYEGDVADSIYETGSGVPDPSAEGHLAEPQYGGRKIIRTISMELETDAFEKQIAALKSDVQKAGGYVQDSSVHGTKPVVAGDSGRSGYYSVRVPANKADGLIDAVAKYGTVVSQGESTQDITDSYFDLETRLEVSRTTLQRLQNILVQTDNLADIITLEQEISRVTYDIESMTSNLRKYDGMIEYATINITIDEEGMRVGPAARTPFGQRVIDGFMENTSNVWNFIEDFAVFILTGLPLFIPIAAVVLLIVGLSKRQRKQDLKNGMPPNLPDSQKKEWRALQTRANKEKKRNDGENNDGSGEGNK